LSLEPTRTAFRSRTPLPNFSIGVGTRAGASRLAALECEPRTVVMTAESL
jgi:hypothetical protein